MAIANTASLTTDFNVDPYYDDFDETKNYHRILFRPGRAVQGRELTQLQTILQNQIDRFGEHVFQEGSVVRGVELFYDKNADYVQLQDQNKNGNDINVNDFDGSIVNASNGVEAEVLTVLSGNETANTKNTLYVSYIKASNTDNVTKTFSNNQVLTTANGGLTANVITSTDSVGKGSILRLGSGVIFAKDHFIRVNDQIVVVGKYNANTNARVGYEIEEKIVDSEDDNTLLDPARGAYNFAAPGANRLKLIPNLVVKGLNESDTENFVEVVSIRNGNIQRDSTKPLYSKINDYIARRTFSESGHYIVNGLNLNLREHLKQANNGGVFTASQGGNTELLSVDVKPGRAHVFGYERDNETTKHVEIDKGIDFVDINAASVTSNYGNYIEVDSVVGQWDYNTHDIVSLRDTKQNAIINNSFSSGVVGNEIGTARVRALEFVTGNKGAPNGTYRMYLYDINMTGGSFSDVRSVFYNATETDGKADVVLDGNGDAVLEEITFNTSIFELPVSATRRLRNPSGNVDTSYQFLKKFDVTIASDGTFSLSTGSSNERFQDTGLQTDTQKNNNFYLVLDNSVESATSVDTGSINSGSNTVTGMTSADSKFNIGDRIRIGSFANTHVVSNVTSTSIDLYDNVSFDASSNGIFKSFVSGSVIDMSGYGGNGNQRSVNITSSTDASLNIEETLSSGVDATILVELNRVNAQEKTKQFRSNRYVQIDTSTNSANTVGPWNLGFSDVFRVKKVKKQSTSFSSENEGVDVTNQFDFDTGQTDNIYKHGKLKLKPNSNLSISSGDYLLVKLDYFDQDTSQGTGYFSVDSYPIDDNNAANTSAITTKEIPVFESPISGTEYSLRDSIDIRPRIDDTSTDATLVSNASINPSDSTTIQEGTGNGLRFSAPNENFIIDLSYYLPRVDLIIMDKEGRFRSIRGTSAKNAVVPASSADGFKLGTVRIAPFPSTIADFEYSPGSDTSEYSFLTEQRLTRYTMKDIGTLEQRIRNLEYYSTLNLLEQSAKSLSITDNNGLSRFKSGFLVDNFLDRLVAATNDSDFKALINVVNRETSPKRYDAFTKLNYDVSKSTGVATSSNDFRLDVTGAGTFTEGETVSTGSGSGQLRYQVQTNRLYVENVTGSFSVGETVTGGSSGATANITSVKEAGDGQYITLPYTHDVIIDQRYASDTRNAAGVAYTWEGLITLDPDTDIWTETTQLPPDRTTVDVQREGVRNTVGFDPSTPWARRLWNQGRRDLPTRRIETRQEVTDTTTSVDTNTTTETIQFIRAQDVKFRGQGLKINGRVFAFFDDVDVNDYCYPTDSNYNATGNMGDPLISDGSGNVYGVFQLPNNEDQKFNTGTLKFKLIDNPNNTQELGTFTTVAEGSFTASGTEEIVQDTIVTTREITTVRERVIYDPVGQTFRVEDSLNDQGLNDRQNPSKTPGMFLTKVDLYFSTKDSNLPIEVQIREVDPSSGYITPNLVPYGRVVLNPEDINTDVSKPVPTPVYFDTPIYLLSDVDYAMVIKPVGGSPRYNIWIARMGETDNITGNRITKNPYTGLLFISANDRAWTAVQEEDVTFRAYFANFGENQTGTATLINQDCEYFNVSNVEFGMRTGQTVDGETSLVLNSQPSANVGEFVQGVSSGANGVLSTFTSNTYSVRDVTIDSKYNTGENVRFLFANGTPTGANSTITSQSTPSGKIQYINSNLPETGKMTLINVTGSFSSNSEFKEQTQGYTGYIDSVVRLNVDEAYFKASKLNLENTTTKTRGKLATTDTTRDSSFIEFTENGETYLNNRKFILGEDQETSGLSGEPSGEFQVVLNNSTNNRHSPVIDKSRTGLITTEYFVNNDITGEDRNEGGKADAKYVSKTVTLAEGLDAEDLRVLVTAYKPSNAQVRVYAKLLNAQDSQTIENRDWQELDKTTNDTITSSDEDKSDYIEFEYNLPDSVLTGSGGEYQYTNNGVTYTGYKYFRIKIVMTTSNTAKVPTLKNYRAIAVQA